MKELSKTFQFKDVEDQWIRFWEEKNLFHAQANPDKKPYSIVIPPPNVTGILHMGHALNNTLQDIIIRYKRMQGFETLWMPGTDHAGIATQNVVEKALAKEGKDRQDIGREAFLKRLWDWKQQYGDTIIHQLKKLGSSCDWARTRFTMDDGYSLAVRKVFVELYKKGLIYRGEYIINWCPRCHTALSDEEAEHQDIQGRLYHIKYSVKDNPEKFLVVATTRPETMLGDTAVAVNPQDDRYHNFIGKTLILPLLNREIPVITDEFVDPAFGTGAVKVTPAHDPNDFHMGQRHQLPFINVMHPDGRINEQGGPFNTLDRFEARKKVIKALEKENRLIKTEDHAHAVGHCYRCHTMVEPYLSKQWFVKMKPLAQPATEVVQKGRVRFYPDRWTKVYLNWMENIRDWCISRQIWWGHRIPVWYCPECPEGKNIVVAEETPPQCPKCQSKKLIQDEDVLDTWFSSWLWPFATFEWPQEDRDLKYFYPTSSLFTAPEIIFFWVARMIMAGLEFQNDIPFSDVYIHGTVRDAKGRKMSKSLGNALDPLEIIDEYGADALRFSLIINSGQDLFISKEKFEIGRNFANKIWNASRLILMRVNTVDPDFDLKSIPADDLVSRWIVSKFYSTLDKVSTAIERFRFSEAETLIYDFFWGHFCDWYLEMIKDRWEDDTTQNLAYKILIMSLKMIHPFMPFVTEEIYSYLSATKEGICIQPWPEIQKELINLDEEAKMQTLIDLITAIRNQRAQWNIKPSTKIECQLTSSLKADLTLLRDSQAIITNLGRIQDLTIEENLGSIKNTVSGIVGNIKYMLPLGNIIDVEQEKKKILLQIKEHQKRKTNISKRLGNQGYLQKAPPDVVEKDRGRLEEIHLKIEKLEQVIQSL